MTSKFNKTDEKAHWDKRTVLSEISKDIAGKPQTKRVTGAPLASLQEIKWQKRKMTNY